MAGRARGLRSPTISERGICYIYGLAPSLPVAVLALSILYFVIRPDMSAFSYIFLAVFYVDALHDVNETLPFVNFHIVLARGTYLLFYFTWGRSLGHMAVDAHVVDRKTLRPMRGWQKVMRGAAQMAGGYLYILDAISAPLALVDRERRSMYDFIAGTVVVIGDLPPEEETAPSRSWMAELGRILRGRPAGDAR